MHDLGAVLLAAGGSSRLGRSKQLLELHGEPLVRRATRLLKGVTPIVNVVTGAKRIEVELVLEDAPVKLVHNERWREGIGLSIALGVDHLPPQARAVLVMLCDQYRLGPGHLASLVAAWREEPARIFAARWNKAFGPPVIFPRTVFPQLSRLTGDRGARQLLVEHRSRVRFVDMPEAGYDVDDPADLVRMRHFEEDEPPV
ncbi:MAG: nucleotidyltransferase family protein [Gammaproteobacteria bacterium]